MGQVSSQVAEKQERVALGYCACALAGCLWSTGFYFGKIVLAEMGVGHMVLYRFLFASVGLLPILLRPGTKTLGAGYGGLSGRDWRALLFASFLGVPVQFLVQFWGLKLTNVSHACLMVGTMPVILAIGATIFTHERLDKWGWVALLGSTAGVGLIVLSGTGATHFVVGASNVPGLSGDLLVVASMFVALGWILINQQLMKRHSPLVITAYGVLSGTAMLAVWVLPVDGPPPVRGVSIHAWLALAASGLLCTSITTLLWNWGIHHVPASRAGVFLNIEPALGSALGVKLMGDTLGPLTWVGGALILAAAVMLTSRGGVDAEGVLE